MNNLEKIQYIKELRGLSLSLEHQALTLFETVKTKKRIQDICYLFKDQGFEKFLPDDLAQHAIKVTAAGPMKIPEAFYQLSNIQTDGLTNSTIAIKTESSLAITPPTTAEEHDSNACKDPLHFYQIASSLTTPISTVQNERLTSVQIGELTYDVQIFDISKNLALYQFTSFHASSCVIIFHEQDAKNLQSCSIYLTEQYDEMGHFQHYLAYFSSSHITKTIEYLEKLQVLHQFKISTVRKTVWSNFEKAMKSNEQLFHCFSQAQNIEYQSDSIISFMPRSLIYGQKIILFDEADCSFKTPIVFLEERQKNRLICGERRLLLDENEEFIPFITYQRQQGLSWKTIQNTIAELPHPIVSSDLIHALNIIVNRT